MNWDHPRRYNYRPLEPGGFRLVQLEHASNADVPLRCYESTAYIGLRPDYQTLSYHWGDPTPTGRIYCDDGSMHSGWLAINADLETLLMSARARKFPPWPLWVDALCIDQENEEEKATQIRMMGEIIAESRYPNIWLGYLPDLGDERSFYRVIRRLLVRAAAFCAEPRNESQRYRLPGDALAAAISRNPAQNRIVEPTKLGLLTLSDYIWWFRFHEYLMKLHVYGGTRMGDRFPEDYTRDLLSFGSEVNDSLQAEIRATVDSSFRDLVVSQDELNVLQKLQQHDWFKRRWIIQELINTQPSRRRVRIRPLAIPYELFDRLVEKSHVANESGPLRWPAWIQYDASRMAGSFDLDFPREEMETKMERTLLQTLHSFHYAESKIPHDRIYALLGISSDRVIDEHSIPIDYQMPLDTLCLTVARKYVQEDYTSLLMAYATVRQNPDLPSWVPYWWSESFHHYHSRKTPVDVCSQSFSGEGPNPDETQRLIQKIKLMPKGMTGSLWEEELKPRAIWRSYDGTDMSDEGSFVDAKDRLIVRGWLSNSPVGRIVAKRSQQSVASPSLPWSPHLVVSSATSYELTDAVRLLLPPQSRLIFVLIEEEEDTEGSTREQFQLSSCFDFLEPPEDMHYDIVCDTDECGPVRLCLRLPHALFDTSVAPQPVCIV